MEEEIPSVEERVIKGLEGFRDMLKHGPSHTITVSQETYDNLIELIENPPDPPQKLIDAVKRYKKDIEEGRLIIRE